jgi:hypothetical protein
MRIPCRASAVANPSASSGSRVHTSWRSGAWPLARRYVTQMADEQGEGAGGFDDEHGEQATHTAGLDDALRPLPTGGRTGKRSRSCRRHRSTAARRPASTDPHERRGRGHRRPWGDRWRSPNSPRVDRPVEPTPPQPGGGHQRVTDDEDDGASRRGVHQPLHQSHLHRPAARIRRGRRSGDRWRGRGDRRDRSRRWLPRNRITTWR